MHNMIRKFNNEKLYEYQTAINKIKEMYGKDFLVFNKSKEAKAYFDKYSYTKDTFSKELQDTLICYSGDYCQAVNQYLNHRQENETPKQFDQWRRPIIEKCLKYLYDYKNWIN